MIDRTRRLAGRAALLAVLMLPSTASAQDARRGAPAQEAAPAATRSGTPTEAPQRAAPAPVPEGTDVPQQRPSRRDTLGKMRAAEVSHRERLAVIHRLRTLAESQGQSEKLALLDKLEVKENSRYASVAETSANRLGDTVAYRQSLIKLATGRLRTTPDEGPKTPGKAAGERSKEAAAAAQTQAEAKRTAGAQGDDASGDKPKKKKLGGKKKRANGANADLPHDPKPERAPPAEGTTAPVTPPKRSHS